MRQAPGHYVRQYAMNFVARALVCCLAIELLSYALKDVGPHWPSLPIFGLIVVLFYLSWRMFSEAEHPTDGYVGEMTVARALKPLELEGYHVLGPRWVGRGDVDQIVVGPTGLFAIEIKEWNGKIEWRGDELYVNGWPRTWKVRKSVAHAMHVKKRLPEALGIGWVEAVTVFSKEFPSVGCRHKKNYWAVPTEDLVGFIRSRSARLTDEECAWIAATL